MLVLTRKTGETIVIPSLGITIKISDIRSDRVRIGISAPSDVPIHRLEVWEREKARLLAMDGDHTEEIELTMVPEHV